MNWQQEKNYFLVAVMFFTRIPVPKSTIYSDEALSQSRKYLPLIGVFIAFLAICTVYVANLLLPLSIAVILSMLVTMLATGAFHEDGFADCCDGFGCGWHKEQILTIMKDSRVGSYAVVGLFLLLSLKALSLIEIGKHSLNLLFVCYINGHALSRLGASICVDLLEYVQNQDDSKTKAITSQKLSITSLIFSGLLLLPCVTILVIFEPVLILTLIPMGIVFIVCCRYFKHRIGGYTGDCLGAIQQILEAIFYLSALALWTF